MNYKSLILVGLLSLSATGCMTNEAGGTLGGATLGALVGSRFGSGGGQALAIAGGTLLGMFIGNRIGQYMDAQDQARLHGALERAPDGYTTEWTNPNSHGHYSVVPTRTYYREVRGYRQPCREFRTRARIGDNTRTVVGTACRASDGSWRVVNR